MWVGEIILGNLGGTAILGSVREFHPGIYAMTPRFALAAVVIAGIAGLVAAYRTDSIQVALRLSVWSGVINGAIACVMIIAIAILFHKARMSDLSNIHEFALSARRAPSQAELSSFLYWTRLAADSIIFGSGLFLG